MEDNKVKCHFHIRVGLIKGAESPTSLSYRHRKYNRVLKVGL